MEFFTKCDELKAFIAPKMEYKIAYLDHHVKEVSYSGRDVHDLYHYMYMLGSPTNSTYSGQQYH